MEGGAETIRFLAQSNTPLIALIVSSLDRYVSGVTDLILRMMNNEQIAPFYYVEHEVIDQAKAQAIISSTDLCSRRSRYVL